MTAGQMTGTSTIVERCQVCEFTELEPVLFLGYLPPVNMMPPIGRPPGEQPAYPAQLLHCPRCRLAQLGLIVDPRVLFPPEYPYTSGTTRILRENFADLAAESAALIGWGERDLVIDIGSNDGTLLSNFHGRSRVLGVEPTDVGRLAPPRGIPTLQAFFSRETARQVLVEHGPARLITATNVFAHIDDVHEIVESIVSLLDPEGVFVSESHYLLPLLETLQYDTVYHEHLRYYALTSLRYLLEQHGLEVFHARPIPTHGGSIRVYAARRGQRPVHASVQELLAREEQAFGAGGLLQGFARRVVQSKLALLAQLHAIKQQGARVAGIGAPSRASTLVNYVGLDERMVEYVCEVKGSHKIGKYMPGTLIPVVEESRLYEDQPEYALIFSWHIGEEIMRNLSRQGYRGRYLLPLPEVRIVDG